VKRTLADGSSTVYIGGIYEKHSDGTNVTYVKYYSALGRRIAMRAGSEGSAGVAHYILADHLGSSTVITDGASAVEGTMKCYPYGATRSTTGSMPTDKPFTGQQKEPERLRLPARRAFMTRRLTGSRRGAVLGVPPAYSLGSKGRLSEPAPVSAPGAPKPRAHTIRRFDRADGATQSRSRLSLDECEHPSPLESSAPGSVDVL
jgi:hypothetical protein